MSAETHGTDERLRFAGHYRSLSDDALARLALCEGLIPAARQALLDELAARGLRDLSPFKRRIDEDAILAEADGLSGFIPVSV